MKPLKPLLLIVLLLSTSLIKANEATFCGSYKLNVQNRWYQSYSSNTNAANDFFCTMNNIVVLTSDGGKLNVHTVKKPSNCSTNYMYLHRCGSKMIGIALDNNIGKDALYFISFELNNEKGQVAKAEKIKDFKSYSAGFIVNFSDNDEHIGVLLYTYKIGNHSSTALTVSTKGVLEWEEAVNMSTKGDTWQLSSLKTSNKGDMNLLISSFHYGTNRKTKCELNLWNYSVGKGAKSLQINFGNQDILSAKSLNQKNGNVLIAAYHYTSKSFNKDKKFNLTYLSYNVDEQRVEYRQSENFEKPESKGNRKSHPEIVDIYEPQKGQIVVLGEYRWRVQAISMSQETQYNYYTSDILVHRISANNYLMQSIYKHQYITNTGINGNNYKILGLSYYSYLDQENNIHIIYQDDPDNSPDNNIKGFNPHGLFKWNKSKIIDISLTPDNTYGYKEYTLKTPTSYASMMVNQTGEMVFVQDKMTKYNYNILVNDPEDKGKEFNVTEVASETVAKEVIENEDEDDNDLEDEEESEEESEEEE